MDKKPEKLVPEVRFKGFTDDWEQHKLGDVAKIIGGGTPNTKIPAYWNGTINWYTPVEIGKKIYINESQRKITLDGLKHSSAKLLPKNSVLFTSRAGIGKMAILGEEATTNQGFQSIIPIAKELDSYFLFSLSNQLKYYGETHGAGSTFTEISGKELAKFKLILPKLNEQKIISKLIMMMDKLISLQQRKLEQLKQLKKAMLQQLFVNKNNKQPNLRFKNFNGDWKQHKLKDISAFENGRAYKQNELLKEGKYPVLRVGNFYTKDQWYYSNLELDKNKYANNGDLLYTWSATFGPHIWSGPQVIYHYHIWKIQISNKINKFFLYSFLEADKVNLLHNTNGSTMIHITKSNMENKVIMYPKTEEQLKIGQISSHINNSITLQQNKLTQLTIFKKYLLQKMFI